MAPQLQSCEPAEEDYFNESEKDKEKKEREQEGRVLYLWASSQFKADVFTGMVAFLVFVGPSVG